MRERYFVILLLIAVIGFILLLLGCSHYHAIHVGPEGRTEVSGWSPKGEAPLLGMGSGQPPTSQPSTRSPSLATSVSDWWLTLGVSFKTLSQVELTAQRATGLMWIGVMIALGGLAMLVFAGWLPFLPTGTGMYIMVAGGVMIVASFFLPTIAVIPWWAWLAVIVGVIMFFCSDLVSHKETQKLLVAAKTNGVKIV